MNRPFQPSLPVGPFVVPYELAIALRNVVTSMLSDGAVRLFIYQASHAMKAPECFASRARAAADLHATERSVQRWGKELRQLGFNRRSGKRAKGLKTQLVQLEAFPAVFGRSSRLGALVEPGAAISPDPAIAAVDAGEIPRSPEQKIGDSGVAAGETHRSPKLRSGIELDPPPPSSTVDQAGEEEERALRFSIGSNAAPFLLCTYSLLADSLEKEFPEVSSEVRTEALYQLGERERDDGKGKHAHVEWARGGDAAVTAWARTRLIVERKRFMQNRTTYLARFEAPATEEQRRAAREREVVRVPTPAELAAAAAEAAEVGGFELMRQAIRGAA